MKLNRLSVKRLCLLIGAGALLSMLAITITFYALTGNELFFLMGAALMICALFWLFLLVLFFGKRLSLFTSELCQTLDNMINGSAEPQRASDSETLFARISHRLTRLYEIMQENYVKQINIEAKTMCSMMYKTFLPSLLSYIETIAEATEKRKRFSPQRLSSPRKNC